MKSYRDLAIFIFLFGVFISGGTNAHLMEPQHGTINIVNDSAFVVLSLPLAAFHHIDDNHDGLVTISELNHHRHHIISHLKSNIFLSDGQHKSQLEEVMLTPMTHYHSLEDPIYYLTVTGKFTLLQAAEDTILHATLYGEKKKEKSLKLTVTKRAERKINKLVLTAENTSGPLLLPDQ